MTEILSTAPSREAGWRDVPDSIELIMEHLEHYALDPVFELYGNFVNRHPEWLSRDDDLRYKGCSVIFGNFLAISHAFYVITDDPALIDQIAAAVRKNKEMPAYQAARDLRLSKVPRLKAFTKAAGLKPGKYMFNGEIVTIKRVYRITEDEANEKSLLHLERWEGFDSEGRAIGGGLPDGDKLSSTEKWAIYQ